jgi:ElaB/YqjD/DUF883 family membrane-anchored ribosome-binding protein
MNSKDIQTEIERTRGEMASTLEAIEQKLSPRQFMDQAVDTMRDIASDNRVGQAVRENPIPLALIGLGIGWLAISGMRGRSAGATIEAGVGGESIQPDYGTSPYATSAYGSAAAAAPSGYGAEGAGYRRGGDGQGQRLKGRAAQMASQARDTLSQTAENTRDKVSQLAENTRRQAAQAADATWEAYQEHPLTMGLVAALLGAGIGAILPRTRQEAEIMGGAAENLIRPIRETGSQLMDKAGRLVGRTAQVAKDETAEAARAVKETAKEEASRQGLTSGEGTTPSTMTH